MQAVLGGEDAAWLHMEEATNPMVVTGVLQLAAPLPLERDRALVARLAAIPRFRARLAPYRRLGLGPPVWREAADLDLDAQMAHVTLRSGDDAELRAFIGRAASALLPMDRPPWHATFVDRPGTGTTLLFRVHHALADGFALLSVLLSLCDDASDPRATAVTPPPPPVARRLGGGARALLRLVSLPRDRATVLKGSLGTEKRVAWTMPLALADVKGVAHGMNVTVNDVLVAAAAGALGRYLARRGEDVAALELHAMVPVNLRRSDEPVTLGNRFGLVVLGLPMGIRDPRARVLAVRQRMQQLKGTPEAVVTAGLLRLMGRAPRKIEDLAVAFFGTKTSLVLTNVPGPRAPLSLAGVPVTGLMFWVPQSARMGLGISIMSYAGKVTMGILADASLVPDPEALVDDLHAEQAALFAGAAAESRAGTPDAPR